MLLSLQNYEVENILGEEMGPLLCFVQSVTAQQTSFVQSVTAQQTSCVTLEEIELLSPAGATAAPPPPP